ncbi:hypothetical protein AURDEDRAFT_166134 [Auricularia subglabra TFB-10046 SS5]|nr:hypothetical protein AURDEDRAFT_166134 [Auricularia subglabra TFB-10046 SS5]
MSTNEPIGKKLADMVGNKDEIQLLEDFFLMFCPAGWSISDAIQTEMVMKTLTDVGRGLFCFTRLEPHPIQHIASSKMTNLRLRTAGGSSSRFGVKNIYLEALTAEKLDARRNAIKPILSQIMPEFYILNHKKGERNLACEADLAEVLLSDEIGYAIDGINVLLGHVGSSFRVIPRGQRQLWTGKRVTVEGDKLEGSMDHCCVMVDTNAPEEEHLLVIIEEKPYDVLRDCEWELFASECRRQRRPRKMNAYPNLKNIVPQVNKYVESEKCMFTMAADGVNNTALEWKKVASDNEDLDRHDCTYIRVGEKNTTTYEVLLLLLIQAIHASKRVTFYQPLPDDPPSEVVAP